NLLVENESPTRLFPPLSSSPPPIPPRSKLRPEPLRIWRPNGGDSDGVPESGSASVLSSPRLTEALRRQFGGIHIGLDSGSGSRAGFGSGFSADEPKGERWGCYGPPGIAQVLEDGAEC